MPVEPSPALDQGRNLGKRHENEAQSHSKSLGRGSLLRTWGAALLPRQQGLFNSKAILAKQPRAWSPI